MELMRALEATLVTDNLDDLFENFLPHLFQIANIRVAEIRLFNDQENLIPVAAAKWVGPEGNRHLKIWSESWVLESPISRTSRQTLARPVQPVFSIPLLHADGMLGFLNIQLDQLEIISREQLNQLYVLGQNEGNPFEPGDCRSQSRTSEHVPDQQGDPPAIHIPQ